MQPNNICGGATSKSTKPAANRIHDRFDYQHITRTTAAICMYKTGMMSIHIYHFVNQAKDSAVRTRLSRTVYRLASLCSRVATFCARSLREIKHRHAHIPVRHVVSASSRRVLYIVGSWYIFCRSCSLLGPRMNKICKARCRDQRSL
jgi:hypothetical protein